MRQNEALRTDDKCAEMARRRKFVVNRRTSHSNMPIAMLISVVIVTGKTSQSFFVFFFWRPPNESPVVGIIGSGDFTRLDGSQFAPEVGNLSLDMFHFPCESNFSILAASFGFIRGSRINYDLTILFGESLPFGVVTCPHASNGHVDSVTFGTHLCATTSDSLSLAILFILVAGPST
jgi:hypothetical protein